MLCCAMFFGQRDGIYPEQWHQESIGFANLSAIFGANRHETDPLNRRVTSREHFIDDNARD